MKFPQYRKLSNEKSFYRIDDERTFFEIQVIGKTSFLLTQLAAQMLKNMIFMLKMGLFLPKNMVLPSTTYCLR
jgi:hypothetical protein